MGDGRDERRPAVILAADIVGYSHLMEADESGTLAQLKTHRKELIDPKIAEYGGRIVKTTGDGMLVEFTSASDAVQQAVDVQRAMAQRNASVPADKRIVFRIGINLGDIIVEGDDIFGEGVNIAARLEESCEPGGVNISGKVHAEVAGKLDLAFDDLGEQAAKNIDKPIRTYRVVLDGDAAVAAPAPVTKPGSARSPWLVPAAVAAVLVIAVVAVAAWQTNRDDGAPQVAATSADQAAPVAQEREAPPLPDKPSIAVLAFDNLSGDPDQEYFSDAISESIITALAQVPNLFVIARNSSFHYKGTATNVTQIAEELGVRYILEGSVQRQGDRVRVIAQFIDGRGDQHLWQQTFDREANDLFALQDDITRRVVTDIANEVRYAGHTTGTRNIEAYDLGVQAKMLFLREAVALGLRAIELDPEYGRANAYLAWARWRNWITGWGEGPEDTIEHASELAQKAVDLDDTDYYSHWTLGYMLSFQGRLDAALDAYDVAANLNPNEPDILALIASLETFKGNHDEAVRKTEAAMRGNPFYPSWYADGLALYLYFARDYEGAIAAAEESLGLTPTAFIAHVYLAASYAQLGQMEEAEAEAAKALQKNPKYTISNALARLPLVNPADREHYREGMLKAGLPEGPEATN